MFLQVVLIISGNLSFLNWLTMVPSIACFDDAALGFLFPSGAGTVKDRVRKLQKEMQETPPPQTYSECPPGWAWPQDTEDSLGSVIPLRKGLYPWR